MTKRHHRPANDVPTDAHHRNRVQHPLITSTTARPQLSTVLEDRFSIQHRELQTLLRDNQKLTATHIELKEQLAVAQKEVRALTAMADDIKAQRDIQVRELYEKSLRMDAEVRSINAMRTELLQVRQDVQNLTLLRQDLTVELQSINDDLVKARAEAKHVPAVKAEIETVRQEIQKGRAAIEQEKHTEASNLEHEQTMEKNRLLLTHEIERLRAELVNVEKQARAVNEAPIASPGLAASYENADARFGRIPNSNSYGTRKDMQGGSDAGPPFASRVNHAGHDFHPPSART